MDFKKTLVIENISKYNDFCDYTEEMMNQADIDRNVCLMRWTVKFDNGIEADLKLCSSDDDIWTEAVLFDDGSPVAISEVCDQLDGEWNFTYGDDSYTIIVS